jgi:TonB family protein
MSAVLVGFYVVAIVSDFGGPTNYRIVDVRADGRDSLVRYIRVGNVDVGCPRLIVQAAEARVRGRSPADLAGSADPCAVTQRSVRAASALGKLDRHVGFFSNVVAQCGSKERALNLPHVVAVDLQRMEASNPGIGALWSLIDNVIRPTFGERDLFADRPEEDDLALQRFGVALIPDLVAGKYERGRKNLLGSYATFRELLRYYPGPVAIARVKAKNNPKLVNAQAYRFLEYQAAVYPPLARQARIQGIVRLQLVIDANTGDVRDATVINGHPLLTPSALAAAKKWRFEAGTNEHLTVEIEYPEDEIDCPRYVMPFVALR